MSCVHGGEILIKIGARGEVCARCEELWDELRFGNVRQILTLHGNVINSMQLVYNINGVSVPSRSHGSDGSKFDCSCVQIGKTLARGEVGGRCEEWNEVCLGKVRQILIMHGNAINSLQVAYQLNGVSVLSHRRGGDGNKFDCINLEPWEVITAVSGHYGPVDDSGMTMVRSLTISTNRPATFGPFGQEEGTEFSFRIPSGRAFAGFHGRSGSGYLRALGIYMKSEARHHFKPDPTRCSTLPALLSAAPEECKDSSDYICYVGGLKDD